jgi:hypothetical protein
VFIPFTKEKNAERFKRSEHFLPAVTAYCPDVGNTRQLVDAIRRNRTIERYARETKSRNALKT